MTAAGVAGVRPARPAAGTAGRGRGVAPAGAERVCAPAGNLWAVGVGPA